MAFESDLIRRYSGAFSKDDCDKIIKGIKFFEDNHLLFYDRTYLTSEDHKVVNVSHDYDFSASSRIGNEILPKVKPCVDEYLQAFAVLNKKKFLLHDLKLKHIPAGGGFHTWHYETGALEVAARQFVIQVYLNDDFEGGETEFLYFNKRIKPKQGRLIIFPCAFTHTHRGNPPIGGTKYLASTWGLMQSRINNNKNEY